VTGQRGIPRRGLLRAAAAAAAFGSPATASQTSQSPAAAAGRGHLFADPSFDFTAWIELGSSYYGVGNPGKLLALTQGITDGDSESAFRAFDAAAAEARQWAEEAAGKGHRVSARDAWLWAAKHYSTALRFLDGTADPSRLLPTWRKYDECWTQAAGLFNPPVERVEIPYESTVLTGWFFRVDESPHPRPLMILNNGADGLEVSSYVLGVAGGLARGYHCLAFNGPGQGDSLWARKLYFRPDWEKVITPVVDYALRRREVDRKRIALIGVSQGGYWIARALAFERRIGAGVADPGVWNVGDAWTRNLPPFLLDMLDKGKKEQFDATMAVGMKMNPKTKTILDFRMRPFGFASYYDAFRAVREYNLKDVAGEIRCPMLVADPESEQFFPGQPRQLFEMLRSPKTLVAFTRDQGADLHCELNAPGYRDYRIYNWLDETLPR
jgi:hypothetical protein